MQSITLKGPEVVVFINNNIYKVTQSIDLEVDYGEEAIFGIDTPYAQEIAGTRVIVRGSVKGLRIKNAGGLQGSNMRPLFTDMAASPYISLRIQDRTTGEDIIFVQNAKVVRENHSSIIKGTYKLNFDFTGQIPLFALDRSS